MASENEEEEPDTGNVEEGTVEEGTVSNDDSVNVRDLFGALSDKIDKLASKIDDAIGSLVENGAVVREDDEDNDDDSNEEDSLEDMNFKL